MDAEGWEKPGAVAEDEDWFCCSLPSPHPLDSGSELRSTSSIHGVVPEGEGEK
jgi:hypothetical protein